MSGSKESGLGEGWDGQWEGDVQDESGTVDLVRLERGYWVPRQRERQESDGHRIRGGTDGGGREGRSTII